MLSINHNEPLASGRGIYHLAQKMLARDCLKGTTVRSKVVAAGENLFARWAQQDGVLILCRIRAPLIHERWIGRDKVGIAEHLERTQVSLLLAPGAIHCEGAPVGSLKPPAAKCERAESLVDVLQELLGAGKPQRCCMRRGERIRVPCTPTRRHEQPTHAPKSRSKFRM